jgi:hypothetical protein
VVIHPLRLKMNRKLFYSWILSGLSMLFVAILANLIRPYIDENVRGIIDPYSSLHKQSSTLICDIPYYLSEIIKDPIQKKSSQVCKTNYIQQKQKVLSLFRHMELISEHDRYSVLIGAYFGVYYQIIYMAREKIKMMNPTLIYYSPDTKYCRVRGVNGHWRMIYNVSDEITVRYSDENFTQRERLFTGTDTCLIRVAFDDLVANG